MAISAPMTTTAIETTKAVQLAVEGLARYRAGDAVNACTLFERALAEDPNLIDAHVNLAAALLCLDRYREALAVAERGLALAPDRLDLLINLATSLVQLDRYDEALAAIDAALAVHPGNAGLLANRALALCGTGRYREGIEAAGALARANGDGAEDVLTIILDEALKTTPAVALEQALSDSFDDGPIRRGALLSLLRRQLHDGASAAALAARATLPDVAPAGWLRTAVDGIALARNGQLDEAEPLLAAAGAEDPELLRVLSDKNRQASPPDSAPKPVSAAALWIAGRLARLNDCDWDGFADLCAGLPALVRRELESGRKEPLQPFLSLHLPLDGRLRLDIARALSRRIADQAERLLPGRRLHAGHTAAERLRIGYLSADFRNHPSAHLMRSLFAQHDRTRFEITAYALLPGDGSRWHRDIAASCERFVDLSGLSNLDAARRIAADGIDILIDLMGHTRYARHEIPAMRPAPVQAGYLGFPGTVGGDWLDYILVDGTVFVPEEAGNFTEQPVYLPDCYMVTDDRQEIAASGMTRSDAGLPADGFVYCCFNGSRKILPGDFASWMRILARVPGAILWLFEGDGEACTSLRREAAAQGIDPARLIFAPYLDKPLHLERIALADLFLDTAVYNAHTTSVDALWAGVPVLTCPGADFPSRVAASHLRAIGLPETIVPTRTAYEDRAVRLAENRAELEALKERLRHRRTTSPLFDTARFARNIERAFAAMWDRHTAGEAPAPISLAP